MFLTKESFVGAKTMFLKFFFEAMHVILIRGSSYLFFLVIISSALKLLPQNEGATFVFNWAVAQGLTSLFLGPATVVFSRVLALGVWSKRFKIQILIFTLFVISGVFYSYYNDELQIPYFNILSLPLKYFNFFILVNLCLMIGMVSRVLKLKMMTIIYSASFLLSAGIIVYSASFLSFGFDELVALTKTILFISIIFLSIALYFSIKNKNIFSSNNEEDLKSLNISHLYGAYLLLLLFVQFVSLLDMIIINSYWEQGLANLVIFVKAYLDRIVLPALVVLTSVLTIFIIRSKKIDISHHLKWGKIISFFIVLLILGLLISIGFLIYIDFFDFNTFEIDFIYILFFSLGVLIVSINSVILDYLALNYSIKQILPIWIFGITCYSTFAYAIINIHSLFVWSFGYFISAILCAGVFIWFLSHKPINTFG